MKKILLIILVAILGIVGLVVVVFKANPKHEIVREAYIYGYPLVTMDMTRRQFSNVATTDDNHAPMGQILRMRKFAAPEDRTAAAPNYETLYTMVWYDLSGGP